MVNTLANTNEASSGKSDELSIIAQILFRLFY